MTPFKLDDLAGLSKPMTKLIEVVAQGVGAVWSHSMSRRIAEATAEAKRIEAGAAVDVAIQEAYVSRAVRAIEADADQKLSIDSLCLPSGSRLGEIAPVQEHLYEQLIFQEAKRQRNIGRITGHAVGAMRADVGDESVDPDWTARFFSEARDVSTPEMQRYWGEVLAREVAVPGSFSLRTLDVLRNMTRAEAEKYTRLVPAIILGDSILAHSERNRLMWSELFELDYLDLKELEHIGLLSMDSSTYQVLFEKAGETISIPIGSWRISFTSAGKVSKLPIHLLTKAGVQVASILDHGEYDERYIQAIIDAFRGTKDIVATRS